MKCTSAGLLFSILVLVFAQHAPAATFQVTTAQCSDLQQAISDANNTPGRDRIEIAPGLNIRPDPSTCGAAPGTKASDFYVSTITDSVDIVFLKDAAGVGSKIRSSQYVIDARGNQPKSCPLAGFQWIAEPAGGLFRIGGRNTDSSGLEVTIDGLTLERMGKWFRVAQGASLTILNSVFGENYPIGDCVAEWIIVSKDATLVIKDTVIYDSWAKSMGGYYLDSSPTIIDAQPGSRVDIERVLADNNLDMRFYAGNAAELNVLSSRFFASGGFELTSGTTARFVNSAWAGRNYLPVGSNNQMEQIQVVTGSKFISEASTFFPMAVAPCTRVDFFEKGGVCAGQALPFLMDRGGTLDLRGTAIGATSLDAPLVKPIGSPSWESQPNTILSDTNTWLQPRDSFDAAAIAALLPNALSETGGLVTDLGPINVKATPALIWSPQIPGPLLSKIDCAANPLVSPIDGSPITTDVNGNPRCDSNGLRDIGAVQISDAPHLLAQPGASPDAIDLTWSTVKPPVTGSITGYQVEYKEASSPTWLTGPLVTDPSAQSVTVSGLALTTLYDFRISALYSVGGASPYSNTATQRTSLDVPGAPPVTLVPGDRQLTVNWGTPPDNGSPISEYFVLYKAVNGTGQGVIVVPFGTNTTTFTGLINGTSYEVSVFAVNLRGGGLPGTATGTTWAAPILAYAAPPSWPRLSPLTLTPTIHGLVGGGTYSVESGRLPLGMSLAPDGTISGTPTDVENTSATIRVTDGTTGLYAEAQVDLSIQDIATPVPQLHYSVLQASVGTPVAVTPTQSLIPAGATFSVDPVGDPMPAGLVLDPATGVVSGAALAAPGKVLNLTIKACWNACTPGVEVLLVPLPLWITPTVAYPVHAPGVIDQVLDVAPAVNTLWAGGVFSVASGSLPAGMTLNPATGVISGTPVTAATNSLVVRYSTGVNVTVPPLEYVESAVSISINPPENSIAYQPYTGPTGAPLSIIPTVSGPLPATYVLAQSTPLPQGLVLDPDTGEISGTPTGAPGTYPVKVIRDNGYSESDVYLTITLETAFVEVIPTLDRYGLVLLALLLLGVGVLGRRRLV